MTPIGKTRVKLVFSNPLDIIILVYLVNDQKCFMSVTHQVDTLLWLKYNITTYSASALQTKLLSAPLFWLRDSQLQKFAAIAMSMYSTIYDLMFLSSYVFHSSSQYTPGDTRNCTYPAGPHNVLRSDMVVINTHWNLDTAKTPVFILNLQQYLRSCIHRMFPCGVCPCSLVTRNTENVSF